MTRDPVRQYRELLASCYGERRAAAQRHVQQAVQDARRVLVTRSFDDGAPIVASCSRERQVARGLEYDVAVDNPDYRAPTGPEPNSAQLGFEPAARPCGCEPARFPAPTARPAERDASGGMPALRSPNADGARPAPSVPATGAPARSSAQQAFTQNQLKTLIQDHELLADIQSILSTEGKPQPPSAKAAASAAASASVIDGPAQPSAPPPETQNEHAIFDKIAQNMRYATAYDLGSIELQQRFDSFDRTRAAPTRRAVPTVIDSAGRELSVAAQGGAQPTATSVATANHFEPSTSEQA